MNRDRFHADCKWEQPAGIFDVAIYAHKLSLIIETAVTESEENG